MTVVKVRENIRVLNEIKRLILLFVEAFEVTTLPCRLLENALEQSSYLLASGCQIPLLSLYLLCTHAHGRLYL
jgi:hypothetical protein